MMPGARALPKIEAVPLPRRAARELRELILTGELAPGERLVERDLAEALGVSRTPVREALFQLATEGLVSCSSRSPFVAPLTCEEIIEIYEMLAALERAAVRRLSAFPSALLNRLRTARLRLAKATDAQSCVAADEAWHQALVGASGNDTLVRAIRPLRDRAKRYELAFFGRSGAPRHSLGQHEAIERLLAAQRFDEAADALEAHWLDNIPAMRAAISAAA